MSKVRYGLLFNQSEPATGQSDHSRLWRYDFAPISKPTMMLFHQIPRQGRIFRRLHANGAADELEWEEQRQKHIHAKAFEPTVWKRAKPAGGRAHGHHNVSSSDPKLFKRLASKCGFECQQTGTGRRREDFRSGTDGTRQYRSKQSFSSDAKPPRPSAEGRESLQ